MVGYYYEMGLFKMAARVGECCGCSGTRSCLLCEQNSASKNESKQNDSISRYFLCLICKKVVRSGNKCNHLEDGREDEKVENHNIIDGLVVFQDFISETEEIDIINEIDKTVWKPSQSGRLKQV